MFLHKRFLLFCVIAWSQWLYLSRAEENISAVTVVPESQKVKENGVVSFLCRVSTEFGNYRLSWVKGDRQISERNPKYMIVNMNQGSVLRVVPARKKDEGSYECRVTGSDQQTVTATGHLQIYAEGRAPPGFPQIRDLTTKVIEKNHNDFLQCLATGNPTPTISWLKDYLPIDLTNPRIKSLERGKLQIERAQESDMGKYECVATNSDGVAHSNGVQVYVKERQVPPQFSRLPENVEVKPGGSVNITCVAIGSPMPYVRWLRGAVELTPPGTTAPIGINVLRLSNVMETTTYTCEASSTLGVITARAEVRLKDLPKAPVDVVAAEVASESVTMSWNSGNDDVTESYVIRYWMRSSTNESYAQVTDITDTEYTVSELVPFTTYFFQVMAVNSIGSSAPSDTLELTTHESVPGTAPQNVRARPVSSSTIAIQWDQPSKPNGQIKGYRLYYSLNVDLPLHLWTTVEVGESLVTTISNLLTNRTYGIRVLAYTSVGSGPASDTITIVTHQGVPEQPGNIRGTPLSATSIELSWEPSDAFIRNIESYEIFGVDVVRRRNFTLSVSPPKTTYTVEGLSPNTRYGFRVAAKSSRGMGPMSPSTEISTRESAPSSAPQAVEGDAVDATTISVRWNPLRERDRNGVITGYRVRYGVASEDSVVASLPPTETAYVIKNLKKWTPYRIAVLAHTEFGDGPYSDAITVYTAEDVPGEPRRVDLSVVNSTAVSMTWRPPAKQELNGIIRGYLLYYLPLLDDGSADGTQHSIDTLNGSISEMTVVGLTPDKEYQFQIAAYTRKGDGKRSRPKKIRTRASAPRNFQLTLKSLDPPAVLATWDPPLSGTPRVATYRLDYQRSGSEGWNQKILPADSKTFLSSSSEKLLNGVEYEFRIAIQRNSESGDFASQIIFIPENVPTGPPVNLRYSLLGASRVKIQWDPPSLSSAGSVLYYEISYRSDDDDDLDDEVHQRNSSDAESVAENLKSSTDYFFQVAACSVSSCGPKSDKLLVELVNPEFVVVEDVQASHTTPNEIAVTWKRPEVPPGCAVEYVVFYGSDPQPDVSTWSSNDATSDLADVLQINDPEVTYYVKVRVKLSNDTFGPFTDVVEVKSSLDGLHSDVIWNVQATVEGPSSIRISWLSPKKPGLDSYIIEYEAELQHKNGAEAASVSSAKTLLNVLRGETGVLVEGLRPGTMYTFTVFAKFLDGTRGPSKSVGAKTLEGLAAPVMQNRLSESSARFQLFNPSAPIEASNVSYILVVVVPKALADTRSPDSFTVEELTAVDDGTLASAWIAAKFGRSNIPESLDIGDNSKFGTGEFTNRPLSETQAYKVFLRIVYTDARSVSSPYSQELSVRAMENIEDPEVESEMQLLWIVAPVCAAVVILLLIVLAVVFIRRSRKEKRTKRLPAVESPLLWPGKISSNDTLEFQQLKLQSQAMTTHPPIPINDLAKHVKDLKENDHQKFSQEYESIEPGQQFTWDASNVEANKPKNRYANVIAYDHSRVPLYPLEGVPGSDYINANFIDGRRKNAYIATQGPLPETFGDFWRMVWEQKCQTIVMMTKLEERNRVKCDQYWPNRGTEVYGLMQVTITDVIELASYTIRTFVITKNNSFEKRNIHQFQFTAWPDHGVPDHPTPLLTFIRRVKAAAASDIGPTVVHCSAGVGRTGAFIVIDAMLDRLEHEKAVDIYGYVTCLRAQRNYMVQTEDQYIFIHEALIEAIETGDTEIPADNLFVRIQHLTQIDPKERISRMELEFRKISEMKMSSNEFPSGNLTVNKLKNRLVNLLPYDSSRVCLQSIRGVEGSDYINANFIDGYRNRRAYIATQAPLLDTTDDFWRMLWENNCTIVVMLTKLRETGREKCYQYWPEDRSARYQYFVVDPVNQYVMPQFILREFKVTDARDGQSRMIRHFQFMDWPEQGVPNSGEGFIEFIGHIQKTREQVGQDGPIVVHCSTGFGRTGVFLTLSIVLEQMRFEGVVDMFQTVKMLRTQRPAMVQTEEQYTFCYRAALEYLSSFDHYAR